MAKWLGSRRARRIATAGIAGHRRGRDYGRGDALVVSGRYRALAILRSEGMTSRGSALAAGFGRESRQSPGTSGVPELKFAT